MGLKEEIRGRVNKVLGSVLVKELGGVTVYIREISVGDRIRMTSEHGKFPSEKRVREDGTEEDLYQGPKLVLVGAADVNGKRIWGDDDWDEVLALPQDAMLTIALEVAKLNGADDDAGNSPESRTDASPSGSAAN